MSAVPVELSPELEKRCLGTDPFEGDFGDGEVTISDKIVTTRKFHEAACHVCIGDIAKGSRSRVKVDRSHGELESYRFCEACCIAMAISSEDAGEEWERRYSLRKAV